MLHSYLQEFLWKEKNKKTRFKNSKKFTEKKIVNFIFNFVLLEIWLSVYNIINLMSTLCSQIMKRFKNNTILSLFTVNYLQNEQKLLFFFF